MTVHTLDLRDLADEFDALSEELTAEGRFDDDESERRYMALTALIDEIGDLHEASDRDPTLIPEDEFEDYARELAEDIGAISPDAQWPVYCIDWSQAARDLAQDYSLVAFDNAYYYTRS